MSVFLDIASDSVNKYLEELCGDHIETYQTDDELIAVLSDGLGSGVKANILATLTSKIALTMLKEGAPIHETVDTIVNTLPECQMRKLAYSTFTLLKIDKDLNAYIVEYDNPEVFIFRRNYLVPLEKSELIINGKVIYETRVQLRVGDMIAVVSDGAVHAGVGARLNLGWQWQDICNYLKDINYIEKNAKKITSDFMAVCKNLYDNKPGDDSTILVVKVREPEYMNVFTGPPKDPKKDGWIINQLEQAKGQKIICGGTTANIASRILERDLQININTMTKEVPPMATMKGYNLITEGVLTLKKTVELIKLYAYENKKINGNDAACILARKLVSDCTHLKLWVGTAVNAAHQNPDIPIDLHIKLKIVKELVKVLNELGKKIELKYI